MNSTICVICSILLISTATASGLFEKSKTGFQSFEDANNGKFGGYEIPTANLSKFCQSYPLEKIVYTDEQIDAKHAELKEYFPRGRDQLESYLRNGNDADGTAAVTQAMSYAVPSIVLSILSLLCFPMFCMYFCCQACCCSKSKLKNNKIVAEQYTRD
jgi:hypothetical protein